MSIENHVCEVWCHLTVCVCLTGVEVELIHEEIKAKHHVWKPFIFRGKIKDKKQEVQVFFLARFNLYVDLQMKDEKPVGSSGDSSAPEPSPFVPPVKPQKKDRPSTFSPTEDSFKDTVNLVKEDSDV